MCRLFLFMSQNLEEKVDNIFMKRVFIKTTGHHEIWNSVSVVDEIHQQRFSIRMHYLPNR